MGALRQILRALGLIFGTGAKIAASEAKMRAKFKKLNYFLIEA